MAISKQVVTDQVTVQEDGTIHARQATRIFEDGNLLTQTYHRTTHYPGDDLAGLADRIVAITRAVWTPECVSTYQEKVAAREQAIKDQAAALEAVRAAAALQDEFSRQAAIAAAPAPQAPAS